MITYAELPESMKQGVLVHLKSDNFVMAKKLLEAYRAMVCKQEVASDVIHTECELVAN